MSGNNRDEDRNVELRSKARAPRGKTASDIQQALDFVRIANDEIRSRKGTP
jgi:hypothetical protein